MPHRHGAAAEPDGGDPLPYSLPPISGVSGNDDWTAVKDRTIKKRIQNRVAQRTYRQRMKDRMTDLQVKLDSCERRLRTKESDGQGGVEESPVPFRQSQNSLQSSSPVGSSAEACSTPGDSILSAGDGRGNDRSNETEINEEQMFSPSTTSYIQERESSQSIDCRVDAQHTLSRLPDTQSNAFALGTESSLPSYLDTEFSAWESSTVTSPLQPVPWTEEVQPDERRCGQASISIPHGTSVVNPISCDEGPQVISNSMGISTDERVICILRQIETMGFDSFDELFSTYYSQNFEEASLISNEQRLSRNRRLPGVVADICCAATNWSTWERRGFYEEILKATETMLKLESLEAQNDLQTRTMRILVAPTSAVSGVPQVVLSLKKSVTSKLPNLWALMMALASSTNQEWKKDHSGTALAAILLLQCAGHIEKDKVLELVRLCL